MKSYSQANQDIWALEYLGFPKSGYYLDIGAMDGLTSSNTYLMEKEFGWNGICVECHPLHLKEIVKHRTCKIVKRALHNTNAAMNFDFRKSTLSTLFEQNGTVVKTISFDKLIEEFNIPTVIDYVSLDIEGAEYLALTTFPFDTHIIKTMTVEHDSYQRGPKMKNDIKELLISKDYILAEEDVTCPDSGNLPFEDWYVHKNYIK